jgi:hypothetical protein
MLDLDVEDDLIEEIPVIIRAEMLEQVPGLFTNGSINVDHFPRIDGSFNVYGGGRTYRVEISGRLAYDQLNDNIRITASSRGKSVYLSRRGNAKSASSAGVSANTLSFRANYMRAAVPPLGASKLLR